MGIESAHNFRVGDFIQPIGGDVLIVDNEAGFGAFDARPFIQRER